MGFHSISLVWYLISDLTDSHNVTICWQNTSEIQIGGYASILTLVYALNRLKYLFSIISDASEIYSDKAHVKLENYCFNFEWSYCPSLKYILSKKNSLSFTCHNTYVLVCFFCKSYDRICSVHWSVLTTPVFLTMVRPFILIALSVL